MLPVLYKKFDHIVDAGCGTGAVIQWLIDHDYEGRITGIEIVPEIADYARRRFADFDGVEIVTGNCIGGVPSDAGIVFAFSPFNLDLARMFFDSIRHVESLIYVGAEAEILIPDRSWLVFKSVLYRQGRERAAILARMTDVEIGQAISRNTGRVVAIEDLPPDTLVDFEETKPVYYCVPRRP